ncbi:hypothetical protein E2C01_073402 [Portunus trituberculatus]|uniref:Uncharacterized protein n=1 Tax=Portunus trituberculatus TaxID=210409 RepID=A0A5B7IAG6_PORTR|nr:hypothetical protein [Portunus trituberculatus]
MLPPATIYLQEKRKKELLPHFSQASLSPKLFSTPPRGQQTSSLRRRLVVTAVASGDWMSSGKPANLTASGVTPGPCLACLASTWACIVLWQVPRCILRNV